MCVGVCICVHMTVCANECVCIRMRVHMNVYICVGVYVCDVYVCICVWEACVCVGGPLCIYQKHETADYYEGKEVDVCDSAFATPVQLHTRRGRLPEHNVTGVLKRPTTSVAATKDTFTSAAAAATAIFNTAQPNIERVIRIRGPLESANAAVVFRVIDATR